MPETQLVKVSGAEAIEQALIGGNLAGLGTNERLAYYKQVCESLGLNPLTKPFEYITLNSKLVLYAKKDATEQLRRVHGVSITKLEKEIQDGVIIFTAYASAKDGRTDIATGAVAIEGLKGEARAIAILKAETKSKRRVTLSICGLGMLDESEIESVQELPVATTLETKALPEAIVAPSAVNSAPATEGASRPVSGQVLDAQVDPLNTPVNAQRGDLPALDVPKAVIPSETGAVSQSAAASTDNSMTSARPSADQFTAYKSRASNLRVKLEKNGFKSSPGQPAGQKLVAYFTRTAGVQKVDELTIAQWDAIFSVLDNLVKTDARRAVEIVDEKIR